MCVNKLSRDPPTVFNMGSSPAGKSFQPPTQRGLFCGHKVVTASVQNQHPIDEILPTLPYGLGTPLGTEVLSVSWIGKKILNQATYPKVLSLSADLWRIQCELVYKQASLGWLQRADNQGSAVA